MISIYCWSWDDDGSLLVTVVIRNKKNFLLRTDFFETFFTSIMDLCAVRTAFISLMLLLACWLLITLDGPYDGPGFSIHLFLG